MSNSKKHLKSGALFVVGLAAGVLIAAIVALPLSYGLYRFAKERGAEDHRERLFSQEKAVPEIDTSAVDVRFMDTGSAASGDATAPPVSRLDGTWCFSPYETVRLTWPAEIMPADDAVDHPYFRIREGANRIRGAGGGMTEFAFQSESSQYLTVYVRCRLPDECGNSIYCQIDGGPRTIMGDVEVYNRWVWVRAFRRFRVSPGTHRLTLQCREDGFMFDRVVISAGRLSTSDLNELAVSPPPAFDNMPIAGDVLPQIGRVTCAAFPSRSTVIGKGHVNELSLYVRNNAVESASCEVRIRSTRGQMLQRHSFDLTEDTPAQLHRWELSLSPGQLYLVPVVVDVFVNGSRAHSQTVNFYRPLSWAFLGPFPDPQSQGVDAVLPPDRMIDELYGTPAVDGYQWIHVDDGSCYDELGVVDLNKVFGLENRPRRRGMKTTDPVVAYAVTRIDGGRGANHTGFAYGGDDAVQVWQNGEPLLKVNANLPLELSRQVVGTQLRPNANDFVFKIPQSESYWQLLFEVDELMLGGDRDMLAGVTQAAGGIGVTFQRVGSGVYVREVLAGGAAAADGRLRRGSLIVGVAEEEGDFTSMEGLSTEQAIRLITGKPGTMVRLQVLSRGRSAKSEPEVIALERKPLERW
jgi:hypothetical protein